MFATTYAGLSQLALQTLHGAFSNQPEHVRMQAVTTRNVPHGCVGSTVNSKATRQRADVYRDKTCTQSPASYLATLKDTN
jgi:hypothetical protein